MKKTKTTHKILCTALSVVLVVGLMPSVAFADGWDDFWNWWFDDTPSYSHSSHHSSDHSTQGADNASNECTNTNTNTNSNDCTPSWGGHDAAQNDNCDKGQGGQEAAPSDQGTEAEKTITLAWNNRVKQISADDAVAQDAAGTLATYLGANAGEANVVVICTFTDANGNTVVIPTEKGTYTETATADGAQAITRTIEVVEKVQPGANEGSDKGWNNGGKSDKCDKKSECDLIKDLFCDKDKHEGENCDKHERDCCFECVVTFNANGGTPEPGSQIVKFGCSTCPVAVPVKPGYGFIGWVDQCGVPFIPGCSPVLFDLNLTAVYQPNNFTVAFDGNGATSGTMDNQDMVYGETEALTPNAFQRTGYKFIGWATDDGTLVADGADGSMLTTDPDATVTLHAQWEAIDYTVAFDGNGATAGSMAPQTLYLDEVGTLSPNGFARTGYVFAGWNTAADGTGTFYDNEAAVENLASTAKTTVTLYAQWAACDYTIIFSKNADDATGVMTDLAMKFDVTAPLTACGFAREGYTFAGWNTMADGTGTAYADQAKVSNLTAAQQGKVTLYAQWTKNEVSISPVTGDSTMLLVGGVAILAVVAAGVLLFLRRREN